MAKRADGADVEQAFRGLMTALAGDRGARFHYFPTTAKIPASDGAHFSEYVLQQERTRFRILSTTTGARSPFGEEWLTGSEILALIRFGLATLSERQIIAAT